MGDTINKPATRGRKLKRLLFVILGITIAVLGYVELANIDSKNMTYRQKLLKAFYPVWMWYTKVTGTNTTVATNTAGVKPPQSFYDLSLQLNDGSRLQFNTLQGKKVLLVNTASNCGYTQQYADLQKLQASLPGKLVVIGFPANDFKQQEKADDATIEQFCTLNFGVRFPLAAKSTVVKKEGQNPVFGWLSDERQNGWNNQAPTWNFCKYLVNEEGVLTHFFASSITPQGDAIRQALGQ
jgi:glutathione peroxidase